MDRNVLILHCIWIICWRFCKYIFRCFFIFKYAEILVTDLVASYLIFYSLKYHKYFLITFCTLSTFLFNIDSLTLLTTSCMDDFNTPILWLNRRTPTRKTAFLYITFTRLATWTLMRRFYLVRSSR